MTRIIFFEDHPYASDNRLLRLRLRRALRDVHVQLAPVWTVTAFERYVRAEDFAVVILDIMARSFEPLLSIDTGNRVPPDMTGIELLRRLRTGYYRPHYKTSTIFIRSARNELHIRMTAERARHDGYFQAGGDDRRLINMVRVALSGHHGPASGSMTAQLAVRSL